MRMDGVFREPGDVRRAATAAADKLSACVSETAESDVAVGRAARGTGLPNPSHIRQNYFNERGNCGLQTFPRCSDLSDMKVFACRRPLRLNCRESVLTVLRITLLSEALSKFLRLFLGSRSPGQSRLHYHPYHQAYVNICVLLLLFLLGAELAVLSVAVYRMGAVLPSRH